MAKRGNVENVTDIRDYRLDGLADELPESGETAVQSRKRRERKVKKFWQQEKIRQARNRHEMAVDMDFLHNKQWSAEDKEELAALGQAALTFNELHPAVEWVCGTEKRTRVDWRILPRKQDQEKEALVKSSVMKYVQDVNKLIFHRSRAFKDAVACGVGWLESGLNDDPGEFPIFGAYESWRNIWWDSLARDHITMNDWRYIHRVKIIDLDVAQAMFPDYRDELKSAAEASSLSPHYQDGYNETQLYYTGNHHTVYDGSEVNDSSNKRSRVKLIETWYREPMNVKRMLGDESVKGAIFDPEDPDITQEIIDAVEYGQIELYDSTVMQMRVMIHIDGETGKVLQDIKSPYAHNKFPFTPIWGYMDDATNDPYGLVRLARDPQEDLNKRRSKLLYALSVKRTIMDEGAVRDMDAYAEEVSRPDSIIEKRKGYDLEIIENNQVAQQHLDLERQDAAYIREVTGVTGENLGLETNAVSGKAIIERKDQGSIVTQSLFDNLRMAVLNSGEVMLSLVEQFVTEPMEFRITGERNTHEFIQVNQQGEEGIENDIAANTADFIVDEVDFRESSRIAMFETMANMLSQMSSEIAIQLLDLLVELSDAPYKDAMVARIRKINGQSDPDTETEEERMEKEEAMAAQAAEERQLQLQDIYLGFEERASKIDKQRKSAAKDYVLALKEAVETAGMTLAEPILAEASGLIVDEAMDRPDDVMQGTPPEQPPMQPIYPNTPEQE